MRPTPSSFVPAHVNVTSYLSRAQANAISAGLRSWDDVWIADNREVQEDRAGPVRTEVGENYELHFTTRAAHPSARHVRRF
jgi:hypothetical protein